MSKIKFAIPKGHLGDKTFQLLKEAGYAVANNHRTYRPRINDPEIELKILRPQEIPVFVSEGLHDIGIAGIDWVKETGSDATMLLNLDYAKINLVLAVPKTWTTINSLSDLLRTFKEENRKLRISTEYLNIATNFLKENVFFKENFGNLSPSVVTPWWRKASDLPIDILLSFGATEAKPPEDADAIIEVVETGISLERNNLKVIETVCDSSAVLIANKNSLKDPVRQEKICDILTLLRGVIDGRKKLHIFLNVSEENLPKIRQKLPGLKSPTISNLSDDGWYSINTVIDRFIFIEILPILRKLSQGLVVYEPRQVLLLDEIAKQQIGIRSDLCDQSSNQNV